MNQARKQWSVAGNQQSLDRFGPACSPIANHPPQSAARGFTLTELLIVVAIIVTVSVATVPLVKPSLDSRRIRESGRMASTQFASAQSEALANGRSAGVWLERMLNEPTACMDMFLCEVPLPYAGDSETSKATITALGPTNASVKFQSSASSDIGWYGLLKPGDLIRFNYSGPYYQLGGPTQQDPPGNVVLKELNTTAFTLTSTNAADMTIHVPPSVSGSWETPYQVYRQPVKASHTPVQLPAGDVIDLYYSGMSGMAISGVSDSFGNSLSSNASLPVIVTFDQTGELESLYYNGTKHSITGPLYFLVGKRDKLASLQTDTSNDNLTDMENLWVAINPQTGLVTTAEVASSASSVQGSRAFATSAQSMGGR